MRASRFFAPSLCFVCFTVFVAACAHAPATRELTTATASVVPAAAPADSAVFDAGSCQKGEFVSVRNGEDYSVLLRAEASSNSSAAAGAAEPQELGWLASRHTDVLINLRPELTRVLALPDSEHGQYQANAKDGRPSRWPTHVEFTCVTSNY